MANAKSTPKARIRKSGRSGAEGNVQKQLTSDRISADLENFEKAGGRVEILGVTRVLTKVDEPTSAG